ncbi:hypothetical protein PYJP_02160 [Pyrofollis japonicus]|uniref:MMPL family transporter n=1 Tax=Pyrofollis japonicus TaxID=3060460 RepID=UPI00295B3E53|nr:MMPL family transporter [Pyrofollis japonicus]BEP16864.1 hypothetical protein PYJP_02160 [Pyrofollis japonicus]
MAEAITSRPLLVVTVWIIVAAVSFPLFVNLSSVVKEKMYTLPSSAESMKAMELMKKVKSGAETHSGVVIVDGVDLESNDTLLKLVKIGYSLNKTALKYSKRITGLPIILAVTNRTLYNQMLDALNKSATGAKKLYATLDQLDKAYAAALENTTKQLSELNKTIDAIIAADKGYVEAYKGLLMLRDSLNKTMNGLIEIDRAYTETTSKVEALGSNLTSLAGTLQLLDKVYAGFYSNLTTASRQLLSLLGNETMVKQLAEGFGYTWWQVSRTYYYMDKLGGNYTAYAEIANLSALDPSLAPLPRDQAMAVWQTVRQEAAKIGDIDQAVLLASAIIYEKQVPVSAKPLTRIIEAAWNTTLAKYKAANNITCLTCMYRVGEGAAESQLQVLGIAKKISGEAASCIYSSREAVAATIIAEMLTKSGVSPDKARVLAGQAVRGTINTTMLAEVVAELAAKQKNLPSNLAAMLADILAKYDPAANGTLASSWEKSLEAAATLLKSMGAPSSIVDELVRLLEDKPKPGREDYARIAATILAEKLGKEAVPLLDLVENYDPAAEGLVASNTSLAARIAADFVYTAAKQRGMSIERSIVEKLAEMMARGEASDEALRKIALDMVLEEAAKKQGEEAAKLLGRVLAKYDPLAQGVLASNRTLAAKAVYELAEEQGRKLPFSLEEFIEMLSNPAAARNVTARLFVEMSAEKAPKEMKNLVRKLAEIVVEKGPGIPDEEKWEIVAQLMKQEMAKTSLSAPIEMPEEFQEKLLGLVISIAKGETSLEEAAKRVSEELLLGSIAPRLINESKGQLVSKDLKAFILMIEPLGETEEERARNIEAVANTTARLFAENRLSAKIYVSGEDILLQQVREYAIRDAEKTSRLSELATFVVLLVLLESVFAVLLPYIGIVLGLAVGGAIVYIAASHGIIDFSSHTQSIMMTTALGLGADYAGYLIYRFKEEYALLGDAREAARRSLKRAGPAIVASALTVIIGFGSLLLAWDISFLRGFGEAIPIAVAATATATLTLVPALLAIVGDKKWFWWPRRPRREKVANRESRAMKWLLRHEKPVLVGVIALILVAGYFYATFHGTHDMKLMLPENAPALRAFEVLSTKFQAGITDPVFIVIETKNSIWEDPATWSAVKKLSDKIASIEGVGEVLGPAYPMGRPAPNATAALKMGGTAFTSKDGRIALIQVVLSIDPYSRKGEDAIREMHRIVHEEAAKLGFRAYMDGNPYATLEMDDILTDEFYHRVLPGAATLMILTFTVIFGGLWVSIAALIVIIGAAMIGIMASTLLFKYIFGKEMLWFMHIITLAAVMGVGMDYNSFFLARALEEYHKTGSDPKRSVVRAAGAVGLFIIGLSLVVSSAYAMLMAANNTGMKEMGFALATTVFTAALMAAYLLTPLVVSILGKHAWWPWGLRKKIEH